MSCLGPYYLPVPPRVWSRVENPCAYTNSDSIQNIPGDYIYLPYLKDPILKSQYYYQLACLKKGNVLQYKANSSNLTKQQRYAQIAKGMWVNRTTTWASQSETTSDPNTKSLKRVNYFNITTDGTPTVDPLTCSLPARPTHYVLPARPGPSNSNAPAVPPPPQENQPGGPIMPPSVTPAIPAAPIVIADGGTLVCNVTQNICTGEILKVTETNQCFLTTASDVPGRPTLLCYNDSLPTVYPKTRLTYPDAGGKWPQGAKLIVAANTTKPISSNDSIATTSADSISNYNSISNYKIYTIDSFGIDDYTVGQIGIYVIYNFNGQNIILRKDFKNLSFYTFFNGTPNSIILQSPNEVIYFYNEFYSSKHGTNNLTLSANQSATLTSVVSSDRSKTSYFMDFNVVNSGKQNSNPVPIITHINNTTNDQYVISLSKEVSDYYIINNYTSSESIILDDNLPNFTIIKLYNLSNNLVKISSSSLIYNTYYQPIGETSYLLDSCGHYSFQLIQTENYKMWIMNSNNIQLNGAVLDGPNYITNVVGDFVTSSNAVYIIESITGNIIIPSMGKNLANIQIFNISENTVQIQTANNSTLFYNDFFAPMQQNGITTFQLSRKTAINFQFMNVENTPAQISLSKTSNIAAVNHPFWTFTVC